MNILLTNDDGIMAKGLAELHDSLELGNTVTVIAPDRERSAVGHGITLHEPLRVTRVEFYHDTWGYSVNGTPVDCIKIGVIGKLAKKPDLVISGINPGMNTGVNINYSGTVAAAREAALYGLPSVAVSITGLKPDNYKTAARFTKEFVNKIMPQEIPFGTVFNVNIPDLPERSIKGVKISRQNTQFFPERLEKREDPRGRKYSWYGYEFLQEFDDDRIDEAVLRDQYISVTPMKCDMTDYSLVDELEGWDIQEEWE